MKFVEILDTLTLDYRTSKTMKDTGVEPHSHLLGKTATWCSAGDKLLRFRTAIPTNWWPVTSAPPRGTAWWSFLVSLSHETGPEEAELSEMTNHTSVDDWVTHQTDDTLVPPTRYTSMFSAIKIGLLGHYVFNISTSETKHKTLWCIFNVCLMMNVWFTFNVRLLMNV